MLAYLNALRLLLLAALVAAAGMVLEIAAPRLAAPFVGTGALAWTIAIATFLAGLAMGYAAGGWLADRPARSTLPALLLLAGVLAYFTPAIHALVQSWVSWLPPGGRVLVAMPVAFLPVSILLGMVPPGLARAFLRDGAAPGMRLGALAAAGAIGSVVGTFLAGFVLLETMGLSGVFHAVGISLGIVALLAPWPRRRPITATPRVPSAVPVRGWAGLAALAGAAILTLEILAGRFASDRLGASVFTWTSVIGVVLSGLALGGLVGGRLADKFAPRRLLVVLFFAASAACATILWAPAVLPWADRWATAGALSWPAAVLAVCTIAFLLPSILLGTLSPVVIRAALTDPRHDGRVVGGLYAAGTLGAVVAAVAVGYFLVPWTGLERLSLLLAFGLASAAGTLRGKQPYLWHGVLVVVALGLSGPWPAANELARTVRLSERALNLTVEDSRLSRIRVQPITERSVALAEGLDTIKVAVDPVLAGQAYYDREAGRLHWRGPMSEAQYDRLFEMAPTQEASEAILRLNKICGHLRLQLRLDRLVHGYVDLEDPAWLGYGYERLYAMVLSRVWPERDVVRCFFIGGGAYAIQRHLLHAHGTGIHCVSTEIDPMVTDVAYEWLDLQTDARHDIVHEDARTYVARSAAAGEQFDVVFGDAFDHIAVPFHLTTQEFARDLEASLAPDGVYLVNVADSWASGRFLGAFLTTLRTVFSDVRVISAAPPQPETRDTFVVVASNASLAGLSGVLRGPEGEAALVYPEEAVQELLTRTGNRVLTDDDAPVDTLLAPVVHSR